MIGWDWGHSPGSGNRLCLVPSLQRLSPVPASLLLDELAAGMDPRQRRIFRGLLAEVTGDVRGLLSTHDPGRATEAAYSALLEGTVAVSG